MNSNALLALIPDLIVVARRDGEVLAYAGGAGVDCALRPGPDATGNPLEAIWPETIARQLKQLVRKALMLRQPTEGGFELNRVRFDVRVTPQGPDRAVCVIRPELAPTAGEAERGREDASLQTHGTAFLRRLDEFVSLAAVREQPAAVAVILVDGIQAVAESLSASFAERLLDAAGERVRESLASAAHMGAFVGHLADGSMAVALATADRVRIEELLRTACERLRAPVHIGEAEFRLTPYTGVASLAQDATSSELLLDHARGAASEARHTGADAPHFFTDIPAVAPLMRMDIARELKEAIASRAIRLRYVGRHELASGRRTSWVGSLSWQHSLRGEIPAAQFLPLVETTGLAPLLSRALFGWLREDLPALSAASSDRARISLAPLRQHVLHHDFIDDMKRFVSEGAVPAERLELRVTEKTLLACDPARLAVLHRWGVQLVVSEVGRSLFSMDLLARAPLWGLQLERSWTAGVCEDAVSLRVCRAGIHAAQALGLVAVAIGIDNANERDALLELGCRFGSGNFYRDAIGDITSRSAEAPARGSTEEPAL